MEDEWKMNGGTMEDERRMKPETGFPTTRRKLLIRLSKAYKTADLTVFESEFE
jgi:hypothetical protein